MAVLTMLKCFVIRWEVCKVSALALPKSLLSAPMRAAMLTYIVPSLPAIFYLILSFKVFMIFERGKIMFGLNSQQTILIVKILLVLILVMIYFLPSGIARSRKHQNILAIFALNLLVGWTFFGWVGALVWSLTSPKTS
jgi:hypothetical protein